MSIGETARYAFEHMVEIMGESILAHKNWNTPQQTSVEVRGLKNSEPGRSRGTVFQFPKDPGLSVGDVLQQNGARDFWRVTELHDDVEAGVFIYLEARVENLHAKAQPARDTSQGHNVVVHGDVHGGIQVASRGSVQHNNVQISKIKNDLQQLKDLFASSALPDLEKEEAALALARITDLASRQKSPDILAKINGKLAELTTLAASVTSLATSAGPLILGFWGKIQNG